VKAPDGFQQFRSENFHGAQSHGFSYTSLTHTFRIHSATKQPSWAMLRSTSYEERFTTTDVIKRLLQHVADHVSNTDSDCLNQSVWNFSVQIFPDWLYCRLLAVRQTHNAISLQITVLKQHINRELLCH